MARSAPRRPAPEPAFDDDHPPSASIVADCVHCGFCLPTCPTYLLWGQEMDSPRGRIQLIHQGLQGEPLTASMAGHFDACLGCLACVTACPSGVRYDRLIEDTKAQVERRHPRTAAERALRRAIFATFPYPRRLRLLRGPLALHRRTGLSRVLRRSGLLDRIAPQLAALEALAPVRAAAPAVPPRLAALGQPRGTVGLLLGCVQREFFPAVNAATARVLRAEGFDVVTPPDQGCCGALSVHTGRADEGRRFARDLVDVFDAAAVDVVVVDAAGCGSTMKEYAALLADDAAYADRAAELAAKVRDVTEFLDQVGPRATYHPLPVTVAYHDACHLGHAQQVRAQPRRLLAAIPGLAVAEIAEADICCGSAGVWNVLNPEPARELGDRKAERVLRTGAQLLVTANPGCLLQIAAALRRRGHQPALAHVVQVLDASIRAAAPAELGVTTAEGSPS